MPIKFVTGKPGGGKGLRTIQLFYDALIADQRLVVSNFPVVLENLQEYCIRKGHSNVNVFKRVRLLRPEEEKTIENDREFREALRAFYKYRTLNGPPEEIPEDEDIELDFVTDGLEEGGNRGCVFIIDEIHKLWPARQYQKVSNRVLEYAAEHRHFTDDVIFVTQRLGQVDKQIRELGQDYEVVRNRGKEKLAYFAGPKSFDIYTYLEPPRGPAVSCVERKSFRLDPGGLCDCYKTASRGGSADKGQYAKGLPWWSLYAAAICIGAGIWVIGVKGPKFLLKKTADSLHVEATPKEKGIEEGLLSKEVPLDKSRNPENHEFLTDSNYNLNPQKTITGLTNINGQFMVWFSDGTKIRIPGSAVSHMDYTAMIIKGVEYKFKTPSPSVESPINSPVRTQENKWNVTGR